ncbi:MAG: tetratricopeptide repeat protein [Dongiaceae bacterium]
MAEERVQRRLAAILAADMVGYSRLMGADETGTLTRFNALRTELLDPKFAQFGGRVVGSAGDSLLVEFASAVDAVQCAVEAQERLAARNTDLPDDRRMAFRMGINLGDVIADAGTIYGDGVNIAARLESVSETGAVVVSRSIHDQVKGKLPFRFTDLGEHVVKNIAEPIRAFRVDRAERSAPRMPMPTEDLPLPTKPSVAVLPFANMSGDPEQEYFSDGITEDIITELSRNRGLFVIARNSSFMFKGPAVDIAEVGRKLGVRYLLEGSVRKAGNRVRVTAQLIEAATASHVWAERYDRSLEDIFAVQDEITEAIVSALPGRIAAALVNKSRHKSTEHLDAYDLYLRGRELSDQHRRDDLPRAKALLEQAIARDPGLARAQALLADLNLQTWWHTDAASDLEAAENASASAVRLDADDSLCHACRGQILLFRRDYDGARHHFERAIALSPNDADIGAMMAIFLTYTGQPEDAIAQVRRAMRFNPLHPQWYVETLGMSSMIARRYEEAVTIFSGMREPAYYVHGYLAGCLAMLGRHDDARRHRERLLEIKPDWTPNHFLRDPYRNADDIEHLRGVMRLAAGVNE